MKKWFLFSFFGLLTIGMGLSLLGEAIIRKYTLDQGWVLWGTVALVVTQSGFCLLGRAVIEKIKINQTKSA